MLRDQRRSSVTLIIVLFAILPVIGLADDEVVVSSGTLSFDERVSCAEKVEDVYWSHRVWPESNPASKPERHEIVPRSLIISKVERSLVLEAALERLRGEPLTTAHIQRELDRIAASTRNPRLLADIFASLGNDPTLIAECYVRPRLVERLLHQTFAWSPELHRDLRNRALSELSEVGFISDLNITSAVITETTWIHADRSKSDWSPDAGELVLQPGEWISELRRLAGRFPTASEEFVTSPAMDPAEFLNRQAGQGVSPLFETDDGFSVVEILAANEDRVRVASATWRKRGIADWIRTVENEMAPADPAVGSYELPKLRTGEPCVDDTWLPTAGSGSPSPRRYHAMVWTGSEVIVWGGFDNTNLATGGRYDPATDTWVPTSMTGAPQGRYGAVAVWTGSEVVIWGGYSNGNPTTGGRYEPVTDTWSPTSEVNAPSGRSYVDGVWSGTEVLVWGGYPYNGTGGRYNPSSDTWTAMSNTGAPSARGYHVLVWTGTDLIVWGGSDGSALATGGVYDPSSDTWTATTTTGAPPASLRLAGVWTGSEMVVWGGDPYGTPLDTGGRYNPSTDTWTGTTTVDAPEARGDHTAVWTGTEMIVWGGRNYSTEYDTGGRYDPSTDTWTAPTTTDAPFPRADHEAVWTGSEMVVWGGLGSGITNTGGRYDPSTDTWVATSADYLSPRRQHTAVWTGTEMIVWGGQDGSPYTNKGSRYDPATDSWSPMSRVDAPLPRSAHSAVWTGTEMIVWGGTPGSSPYLNTGGRYNPVTDSWTATSTAGAPAGRYYHAAVWTGTEMTIWTGMVSGASSQTGGRYDPASDTWAATSLVGAPSSLYFTVAVWSGSEMLVWGGYPTTDVGARYDPALDVWTPISTTGAPEARQYHTGIWTGSELVVWGGMDGATNLNSGGRYDPVTDTWATMSTVSAPTGRSFLGSVWTGSEMIVWAGYGDSGPVNTGGRYNPNTDSWTLTATIGAPSPRSEHVSVWTGSGEEMIVWGGNGTSLKTDTGGRYCASGILGIDFGDAPDPGYPTLLASDGARHFFDGFLHLGATVDGEPDGQQTADATGDDNDGTDDEDGVVLPTSLLAGAGEPVDVTASAAGLLNAWVDFNADGDWDDPGEQIFTDESLAAGVNNLTTNVPLDAAAASTFARFRFDSAGGLTPIGVAGDGEVEDYQIEILPSADLAVTIGDSPDPVPEGGLLTYFLTVTNNGQLAATAVELQHTLPAEGSFSSVSSGSCSETGGVVTCDLGTIASGASVEIEVEFTVDFGTVGTIISTAAVQTTDPDPITTNDADTETTIVVDEPTYIFSDGFETGGTTRWSLTEP